VEKYKKITFAGQYDAMLNRKLAPVIHKISELPLPVLENGLSSNGIPIFSLPYPGTEILKIEFVFQAGRPQEAKHLVAKTCARLIREGSKNRTGAQIAEWMDYYGSSFSNPSNLDTANFVVYTLKKYAHEVIPVVAEAIIEPSFPDRELQSYRDNSLRELQVELRKGEVQAYRHLTENIFGADHPYGYNSSEPGYRAVSLEDIVSHHKNLYTAANCKIFLSGDLDEQVFKILDDAIRPMPKGAAARPFEWTAPHPAPSRQELIEPHSLQAAIKIGRRLFTRSHPDYPGMYVLNNILGGYFGSRLMTNIREKKGYTYNIYSSVDAMQFDGYFYIATEVNKGKSKDTIKQIYRELKDLCDNPVEQHELDMVRNYLMGMLLNGLDGPTNTSDLVRGIMSDGMPLSALQDLAEGIQSVTAKQLQDLANTYFQPEDLWTVVVR
jgi:predicted Zn-dependent peptidase